MVNGSLQDQSTPKSKRTDHGGMNRMEYMRGYDTLVVAFGAEAAARVAARVRVPMRGVVGVDCGRVRKTRIVRSISEPECRYRVYR